MGDVYHLWPRFAHPFSRGPRSAERREDMQRKMTRTTFLLGVAGTAALATLGVPATAQTARRNVLWIVDDDHPQYMMDPMPVTRRKIRDQGLNIHFRLYGHTLMWTR